MAQKELIDDKNVTSIEIGAGCGNFGKVFHPKCYLTDIDSTLETNSTGSQIDWICNATQLPWSKDRFKNIILCNPYLYGFNDDENTEKLMDELLRVLNFTDGKILLICHERNKYCAPERVQKRLATYSQNKQLNLSVNIEKIAPSIEYKGYVFKQSMGEITIPNSRITIYVNQ